MTLKGIAIWLDQFFVKDVVPLERKIEALTQTTDLGDNTQFLLSYAYGFWTASYINTSPEEDMTSDTALFTGRGKTANQAVDNLRGQLRAARRLAKGDTQHAQG